MLLQRSVREGRGGSGIVQQVSRWGMWILNRGSLRPCLRSTRGPITAAAPASHTPCPLHAMLPSNASCSAQQYSPAVQPSSVGTRGSSHAAEKCPLGESGEGAGGTPGGGEGGPQAGVPNHADAVEVGRRRPGAGQAAGEPALIGGRGRRGGRAPERVGQCLGLGAGQRLLSLAHKTQGAACCAAAPSVAAALAARGMAVHSMAVHCSAHRLKPTKQCSQVEAQGEDPEGVWQELGQRPQQLVVAAQNEAQRAEHQAAATPTAGCSCTERSAARGAAGSSGLDSGAEHSAHSGRQHKQHSRASIVGNGT